MSRATRLVLAALLAGLLPATAMAFPLTTCTVTLTSLAADGTTLDTAQSGADDATRTDPFLIDWDGTVAWQGTTGGIVFTDFSWGLSVSGVPLPLGGLVNNASGLTEGSGSVVPSEVLPIELVGLFYVTGHATGDAGSCEGSGWIQIQGDAFGSMQFWIGLALLAIGLLLVVFGRGGRWFLGLVGGALGGVGGAILAITFSFMPIGEWTPLVAVLAGILIGLALTVRKESETPAEPSAPSGSSSTPPPVQPPEPPPTEPPPAADGGETA